MRRSSGEVRLRGRRRFGETAFALDHERRLVDLTGIEPVTS
jgi:hypothetical protein